MQAHAYDPAMMPTWLQAISWHDVLSDGWKALLQGGTTFGALWLGARFTRQAADRAATRQQQLAEDADARRRKLDEDAARERVRLDAVRARLEEQREVYRDYEQLVERWSDIPRPPLRDLVRSVTGEGPNLHVERRRSLLAETSAIATRITLAFHSVDFAEQASFAVVMLAASESDAAARFAAARLCAKCSSGMRKALLATEQQLGVPLPAVVPEPPTPPDEHRRMTTRAFIESVGTEQRWPKQKIDELVARSEQMLAQPATAVDE